MAQVECVKSLQEVSNNKLAEEDDEGPPSKKLRQARLPFKPLDQKPQLIPSSSPQNSKKRKLSDGESPSAKPPKSHKPVIVEKPPPMVDHDPEVSSSSETENIPFNNIKVRVRNTLERFVRKNSQEEISSTNTDDCIDLTEEAVDSSVNEVSVDKENETNNDTLSVKITNDIVSQSLCDGEDQQEPASSNQNEREIQDEAVSSKLDKLESEKIKENEASKSCLEDESSQSKQCDLELQSSIQSPKPSKPEEASKNKSPHQKASKLEKTPKGGIDAFLKKVSDRKLNFVDKAKEAADKNKVDTKDDDDIEMLLEEKHDNRLDIADDDADDEEDCSSTSNSQTNNVGLVTPAKENSNTALMKTPGSVGKPDKFVTPSCSPTGSVGGTPTSTKTRTLSAAKLKEREEVRQQREKEREEKRLQKEQERVEKEKEKEEKRKQREEEKAEKERQKQEEKDKREKERQERLKQKEDERRKKQEILDAKNEERKKKEEEKKQKEEEKNKEIEEKQKKESKVKQAFAGFFIPKTSPVSKPSKETSGLFMPFEPKANMILAPTYRRNKLEEEEKESLDKSIIEQECTDLYLQELRTGKSKHRKSDRTCPRTLGTDDDVILVHDKETVKKVTYHCKLLQFRENYRPPYYGTWRKKSKVLSAKNPFKQDSDLFDYEVDSDDEWEEEEPGESLSASEGEDEKEDGADEDDEDGWMVPHGYLSDDEGCEEDEEVTSETKSARQMAKAEAWEAELKRQACRIMPVVIGCLWEQAVHSLQEKVEKTLQIYKAVNLLDGPVPTSHSKVFGKGTLVQEGERPASATPKSGQKKPVPEEAMPDLIRMVHGNLAGIKKLVKEFRTYWNMKTGEKCQEKPGDVSMEVDSFVDEGAKKEDMKDESCNEKPMDTSVSENSADNFSISKRQLELTISAVAVREKREGFKKVCWYVHDNLLQQYNLQELPVPSAWEFVTKPFKTPNKQKTEDSPVAVVGRKTPTISITQFARPMSPSMIAAQNAAVMASMKPTQSAKSLDIKMEIESEIKETKTVPSDQRTIMQFTKKVTSPQEPASKLTSTQEPASNQALPPGTRTLAAMLGSPVAQSNSLRVSQEPASNQALPPGTQTLAAMLGSPVAQSNGMRVSPKKRKIIPKPVTFSPVGSEQSKLIVDLSQPDIVTVISPKPTKSVSKDVNIIPPSMIRSNLKQSNKSLQGLNFKTQLHEGGKNSTLPEIRINAVSNSSSQIGNKVLSPKRVTVQNESDALNVSSSSGPGNSSVLSPIVSVLKQMGHNSAEAILIE